MSDAVREITERVRERVRLEIPGADRSAAAAAYAHDEVRRYAERALGGTVPVLADEKAAEAQVIAAVSGLGPLQQYLDDPSVEEIWINQPHRVFVARDGKSELTPLVLTEAEVRDLVERMLASSGRRVDVSQPFVDASLADGSRLHVVIPDVSRAWSVNIRKFSARIRELQQLVALGSLSRQAAEFLRMSVLAGCNILVAGATQSGKTTLLGALMSAARRTDRVITVEETFELDLAVRDVVAMQCRQPSLEGSGEITLRRLIKEALRMRPDRIVVGEVREAEALDLLLALNAGVPGMGIGDSKLAGASGSKELAQPLKRFGAFLWGHGNAARLAPPLIERRVRPHRREALGAVRRRDEGQRVEVVGHVSQAMRDASRGVRSSTSSVRRSRRREAGGGRGWRASRGDRAVVLQVHHRRRHEACSV